MNEESLEQELRDCLQMEVRKMEPTLWWAGALSRATEQKRGNGWLATVARHGLAWASVPVALLLIAGVAYASSSVVRELFVRFAPWVEHGGLVREMDLSQTIDGVTVRIERVYADSNAVLVGYTVSGPDERYFAAGGKLSTLDGKNLHRLFGAGVVPGSDIITGGWRPSERTAFIAAFDASLLRGEPSAIRLHLETRVDRPPLPEGFQSSTGPFSFDFDVPFNAAKSINVGQTAEAGGASIGLEQVIISPWATRTFFKFYPPYDDGCMPVVSLQLPNGVSNAGSLGGVPGDSPSEYAEYFTGDFTAQHGEWTIVISELVLPSDKDAEWTEVEVDGQKVMVGKGGESKTLAGPWVFRFEVP